jgi:O-antigen/teichoic acid export membrane protein
LNSAVKRPPLTGLLARGVVSQVILAAGNFAVTLILLRYASNEQYGSYVLVFNAVLILASLQGALVGPAMVNRLNQLGPEGRADLIGGLYAGQRWALPRVFGACAAGIAILWSIRKFDSATTWLMVVALTAAWTGLYRQFFRMVANAYRNASATLRADVAYATLMLCGAAVGIATPAPAIVTLLFMSVGGIASGVESSRLLWRNEHWNVRATPRVWREIAAVGVWPATGTVAYWAYNQGYSYLIAGTVSLTAVAALASTRTLMMPITLLSTGVSPLMLATVSVWLREHGVRSTLRRVTLAAAAMAAMALCYAALFWPARDFIFARILRKSFAQRDLLLLLWWLASIAMVTRDQFTNFLLARARYRPLTALTVTSAIIALTVTGITIGRIGAAGAAIGVLAGEFANVLGLITLSRREVRIALKEDGQPRGTRASGD